MRPDNRKKYELTDLTKNFGDLVLHRIRALICMPSVGVVAGDLGGWIESERNLSHCGDAWVHNAAQVLGNAWVCDNARIFDKARVFGNAEVYGEAKVYGGAWVHGGARVFENAKVHGNAEVYGEAKVYGDAVVCAGARVHGCADVRGDARVESMRDYVTLKNVWSSGRHYTYTRSNKMWAAGCFHGTGEELVAQAYEDDALTGKCYEKFVKCVESAYDAFYDAMRAGMPNYLFSREAVEKYRDKFFGGPGSDFDRLICEPFGDGKGKYVWFWY